MESATESGWRKHNIMYQQSGNQLLCWVSALGNILHLNSRIRSEEMHLNSRIRSEENL